MDGECPIGGPTLLGGESTLGGVALLCSGRSIQKTLVPNHRGQSLPTEDGHENVAFYFDSTSVFVKYFGVKII